MPFADKLVIVYLPAFEASLLPQPAKIPTEANETDEIAIYDSTNQDLDDV